jgi:hypothetical protein
MAVQEIVVLLAYSLGYLGSIAWAAKAAEDKNRHTLLWVMLGGFPRANYFIGVVVFEKT